METQSMTMGNKLPGVKELFSQTHKILMERWKFFLTLVLLPSAIVFIGEILGFSLGYAGVVVGTILVVLGSIGTIFANIAIILGSEKKELTDWKKAYGMAKPFFWSLIWASILVGIVNMIGFLLLIIPGIYLSVVFSAFTFVLVLEGKKGWSSAQRSKELVKGYWWAVFGRLLAFAAIAILLTLLILALFVATGSDPESGGLFESIVNLVVTVLLFPFGVIYQYLIYKGLVGMKRTTN